VLGVLAALSVRHERLAPHLPGPDASLAERLHIFEPGGPLQSPATHPSIGWALATGLAVALAYALSIIAHELGHLLAARQSGFGVSAVVLHLFGGHVEMDDDDRLTAGRLAWIAGAGLLVTAALALAAGVAIAALGWPFSGSPYSESSADVAAGQILSSVFAINAFALVMNLLPVRMLDGGELLAAARLWRARKG
jgi:Zn-dependent protease